MATSQPLHPVVKQLEYHIKDTSGCSQRFEDAVKTAHNTGIVDAQAVNTTNYYFNKINEWLYWVPRENEEGQDVYNRICLFYFVMNQPTIKPLQDAIAPTSINVQNAWLTEWLHTYADELGKFFDTPESIEIHTFWNSPNYNMKEYVGPRGGWRDFNARSVKPGFRPIAAISDPRVIVSPTDSTYGGQWEIRSDSGVAIKGVHWDVSELLKDCPYKNDFNGGIFMHSFLGPNGYHRQHCPIGGNVVWAKNIRGDVYLEVNTVPIPETEV